MCSALGWVCVADAAGRRFLLPFFVLCSHHANVACTIPQKNSTLNDPLQSLLQSPSLATNFIEPLARTPARHNFNWCRHEKQLLHKLTRHQHSVYSCYLFPTPYTPATSYPSLAAASPCPPCAVFCQLKLPNCHLVASLLAFFICWF